MNFFVIFLCTMLSLCQDKMRRRSLSADKQTRAEGEKIERKVSVNQDESLTDLQILIKYFNFFRIFLMIY